MSYKCGILSEVKVFVFSSKGPIGGMADDWGESFAQCWVSEKHSILCFHRLPERVPYNYRCISFAEVLVIEWLLKQKLNAASLAEE